jgi:hypothetical protein
MKQSTRASSNEYDQNGPTEGGPENRFHDNTRQSGLYASIIAFPKIETPAAED